MWKPKWNLNITLNYVIEWNDSCKKKRNPKEICEKQIMEYLKIQNMKISYGKNVYGNEEVRAVLNQLKKTTLMGVCVSKFEKKIANIFSKKYGLMVNSGSSALTLANNVLNFKKGDVLVFPSSFMFPHGVKI